MVIDWFLFGSAVVALAVCAVVLVRHKTAILGLNALNVFMVASASLPGFMFGSVTGKLPESFTPEHHEVLIYSILGLFAMAAGMYLGWRRPAWPLCIEGQFGPFRSWRPNHVNQQVGWLTFWVGAAAEVVLPFVYGIPTVSTAIYCLSLLTRIGLGLLLITAINGDDPRRFYVALGSFVSLSLIGAFASGFSFLRFTSLFPLIVVWFVGTGVSVTGILRACVTAPIAAAVLFATTSAWLETRQLIRRGLLDSLPWVEKLSEFFGAYLAHLHFPTMDSMMRTIMERVDMTNILAAQVRHQPALEPYAYGRTFLSSLYTLVPRALWSDKPVIAGGSAFVSQFTGLRWDSATSVGLPYQFELYANGGPALVIIGLGAIGYVCARLEMKLVAPQRSLGGFWATALVAAVLTEGGQRTDVVLPALVASALAAYVLGTAVDRLAPTVVRNSFTSSRSTQAFQLRSDNRDTGGGRVLV
jgi:hypothetical protein